MHLFGTHSGPYEVVRDASGQPALLGFGLDPKPSMVGAAYLDPKDHASRILTPMVRKGWLASRESLAESGHDRGRDEFIAIDWNEAIALVAGEYREAGVLAPTWDQIERYTSHLVTFGGFGMSNAQVEAGGIGSHRVAGWLALL